MAEDTLVEDELCSSTDGLNQKDTKKWEANRKKREKAKAKKSKAKALAGGVGDLGTLASTFETPLTSEDRQMKGILPGGRAERRDAGAGRGLGVFANESIAQDECIACAVPSLSVIFDASVDEVCGFCFDTSEKGASTEHIVELQTSAAGFGIQLDNFQEVGASAKSTIVTKVTSESPNRGVVQIGDQFITVGGQPVDGGHEVAVPLLQAAVKNEGKASCVVRRPALLSCPGCKRFACCARCVSEGRMKWHTYECSCYQTINGIDKAGESATVRMLLRYKLSSEPKVGEWCVDKEPVSLLMSLQANPTDVPADQLANLARLTSLPAADVSNLIYQVRTNACEITRGGKKVGCALSVLMGWHNHDCLPNAQPTVDANGNVTLRALRDIAEGEEINISYMDAMKGYDERRKILQEHYGFECTCERCAMEKKAELKRSMELKRNYLAGQRR